MSSDMRIDARCEERVWDNGDMTDCGKRLPCSKHPAEQVAAREILEAIHRLLENRYEPGERYTDRLMSVAQLAVALTDGSAEASPDADRALRVLPEQLAGVFWDDVRKRLASEFFRQRIEHNAALAKKTSADRGDQALDALMDYAWKIANTDAPIERVDDAASVLRGLIMAEVDQLRALVRDALSKGPERRCPWCWVVSHKGKHAPDCPAMVMLRLEPVVKGEGEK